MEWMLLPVIFAALVIAAGSAQELSPNAPSEELHAEAATYISNRRLIPGQHIVHGNNTDPNIKGIRSIYQLFSSSKTGSVSSSKTTKRSNVSEDDSVSAESGVGRKDPNVSKDNNEDGMLMAGAGRRKSKSKRGDDDDDDEEKKTLSQQIADGKYGLIEKDIYATTPKRPGIISYSSNPEVPRDTAKNLGGLEPEEIWLAENHVLVLRGGFFPEHKFNRTDDTATAWPPIDNFNAPPRQVKIPANPKVPPPFPVQLTDDGPTQFIGFNGSAGHPPFPPFFPQPPPGNGSYFAPPFPFPPPGNFTPGFYPPIPPGNYTPGGGFYPPPGNGSFSPPRFPYPLPPPRNGSFFVPPPGNFTPGSGPFYPPPFPGYPPLPHNGSLYPPHQRPGIFPPRLPPNGTLPFPPPFFPNLPPGAIFLPPPGNMTDLFDEDDPSLYYPPPYDFYYPQDNSTEVPPGPLVPGIILPPPPNFFAPLTNTSEINTKQYITTTEPPVTRTPEPPYGSYLPAVSRPPVSKNRRPQVAYLPVTTQLRKKPRPTETAVDNDAINHITPEPEIYVLTTPSPDKQDLNRYTEKPPRPYINVVLQNVQVTHQGKSPVEHVPQHNYYDKPTQLKPAPEPLYISNGYSKVKSDAVVTTKVPAIAIFSVPVTDIVVQSSPKPQPAVNASKQQDIPDKTLYQYDYSKENKLQSESPRGRGKKLNIPTTTLAPLLVYYNQRQPQDIESNTVTPSPQPYYVKAKSGITATLPPRTVYYTLPSTSKANEPTSVKASYYFYEEPNEASAEERDTEPSVTTQAPPSTYTTPTTAPPRWQYRGGISGTPQTQNIPSTRQRTISQKPQSQYKYSDLLPVTEQPQQYIYSEAPPANSPTRDATQTARPQAYSDVLSTRTPVKVSVQPQQYIYSNAGRVNGVRQRTQPQYILSPVLPVDQQVIFPSRGKLTQVSKPAPPPQYYYVTASPGLRYDVSSTTPSPINQGYRSQLAQQEYIKSTQIPLPVVSKLTYFTTPRPNFAYQDVSSQRPIFYNIQPASTPRPIYQYTFEKNKNLSTQPPLRQNVYSTIRTKLRLSPQLNYQNNQGSVIPPVQVSTTPRTLFEYSYEQQGISTKAPEVQGLYPIINPQYDHEEVTAGSPTTHYGYDDGREQENEYQTTPQPRYNRYQNQPPQVNIYPTANPLHAYFTRQDESLLDDITKKYFTIFGQKLPSGDENVPTTPISPYASGSVQTQSKQPYKVNAPRQYYTTPNPNNYPSSERPLENSQGGKGPISLADDINVNYKNPPPVNPLSEYVDTRQIGDSETGSALVSYKFPGDGGHFYFITPQVVGVQQSQQSINGYIYDIPRQEPQQLGVTYRRKKRKQR